MTLEELQKLMDSRENEHIEFKEAKNSYEFDNLVKYCIALANEGGGHLILGITDKIPRRVVSSSAFNNLEQTKSNLFQRLHLRIDAQEIQHSDGRVVVFTIPSRPIGKPIEYRGTFWMRSGDSLVGMTSEQIKSILLETGPDFSAEICEGATIIDLDSTAIETLRDMWIRKSGNTNLSNVSKEQLLEDAEAMIDGRVTYAALVLLGTHKALGKYLGCAEVIFEYRSTETTLPSQQREEYRNGFFLYYNDLWKTINLRNDIQQYQEGFFRWDIPTFNEKVVREAILNAISHRDYRLTPPVFVRQYPRKLVVESPGGFPEGVTQHNIYNKQVPRNKRIAEVFSKCGLVERSGQGMDRMYRECIKESKSVPDFTGTDDYQVSLTLNSKIQDPKFLRFFQQLDKERLASFSTEDFLVVDLVHKGREIPSNLKGRLSKLIDLQVIERVGRTKGAKYILSRKFYNFLDKKGTYTRKRGLDRNRNKELLLKHIEDNNREGSPLKDLQQVLPNLSYTQVQILLQELKNEGRIYPKGKTKGARWFFNSEAQ